MKRDGVLSLFVFAAVAAEIVACATNEEPFTETAVVGSGGAAGMAGGVGGAAGSAGAGGATADGAAGTGGSTGTGGAAGSGGFGTDLSDYRLDAPITSAGIPNTGVTANNGRCDTIAGIVRDFKDATEPDGHADFEAFWGSSATKGLVEALLGSDELPVYTGICETGAKTATCPYGQQTTSKANFNQWYRNTAGVNQPYLVYLGFVPGSNGMTFASHAFFPLDNAGWGNNHTSGGGSHNYAFTTELRTTITYIGGETFMFTGDDDLWVFINGRLAMDLGGPHPQISGTIDLDQQAAALGITLGQEYTLHLFHAERHTFESNFRIDTNFAFTDCGSSIPGEF